MNRVWITRTLPAAKTTATAVRDLGFDTIVSPLLKVVQLDTTPPVPEDNCLLVFTSKNAVRAFCSLVDKRHWPVVTVGDATADMAKQCGFDDVMSAAGTGREVIKLIKSTVKQTTPIIHCAGETIRVNIADSLDLLGFKAKHDIYYRTVPVDNSPGDLDDINYVLLHSPLAAKTLRELNLHTSHMTSISISEAADIELGTLVLRERRIANAPTEAALLACLHS